MNIPAWNLMISAKGTAPSNNPTSLCGPVHSVRGANQCAVSIRHPAGQVCVPSPPSPTIFISLTCSPLSPSPSLSLSVSFLLLLPHRPAESWRDWRRWPGVSTLSQSFGPTGWDLRYLPTTAPSLPTPNPAIARPVVCSVQSASLCHSWGLKQRADWEGKAECHTLVFITYRPCFWKGCVIALAYLLCSIKQYQICTYNPGL